MISSACGVALPIGICHGLNSAHSPRIVTKVRNGMRLAELQLKIVWQEMLKRFDRIEVVDEPKRVYSSFVRGIEQLPVRIPA